MRGTPGALAEDKLCFGEAQPTASKCPLGLWQELQTLLSRPGEPGLEPRTVQGKRPGFLPAPACLFFHGRLYAEDRKSCWPCPGRLSEGLWPALGNLGWPPKLQGLPWGSRGVTHTTLRLLPAVV